MSLPANIMFLVTAVLAIGGAIATVVARKPLRAAMGLLLHIGALAGLYLVLKAEMLAAIQLLVYAGAVVVLFVFVIMLIGPSSEVHADARGLPLRAVSACLMAFVTIAIAFGVLGVDPPIGHVHRCDPGMDCVQFGGVDGLAASIFRHGLVPFELVGVTLLVAIIGAMAVARGKTAAEAEAARQLRAEREADEAARKERERQLSDEVAAHGGH